MKTGKRIPDTGKKLHVFPLEVFASSGCASGFVVIRRGKVRPNGRREIHAFDFCEFLNGLRVSRMEPQRGAKSTEGGRR